MDTKKKPATPLPWRASAEGIVGQRSLLTVAPTVKFLDDREYASHAANAYPTMVRVLREIAQRSPKDVHGDGATESAREVLRIIGEAE